MRDIKGYEGIYKINKNGNVLSVKKNIFLKRAINKGYEYVTLYDGIKRKNMFIHRLLALAFIPNSENKKTINHKDGNPLNNNLHNLEWCTQKENTAHAINNGLWNPSFWEGKKGKNHGRSKTVKQISLDGGLIQIHYGCHEAGRETNISYKDISSVCLGKRRSAGGYKWEYA